MGGGARKGAGRGVVQDLAEELGEGEQHWREDYQSQRDGGRTASLKKMGKNLMVCNGGNAMHARKKKAALRELDPTGMPLAPPRSL